MINLLISLRNLLARENIEGFFFQIEYADVVKWSLDSFIVCLRLPR